MTTNEQIAEDFKKVIVFKDLKIVDIEDYGDVVILTLKFGRKKFKLEIRGKGKLRNSEGKIVAEIGEEKQEKYTTVYPNLPVHIPNEWRYYVTTGGTSDGTYVTNTTWSDIFSKVDDSTAKY